jgi:hypothetical protein
MYLLVFTHIFTGDLDFKGLTARRLYKSFGVKGLIQLLFFVLALPCGSTPGQDGSILNRPAVSQIKLITSTNCGTYTVNTS